LFFIFFLVSVQAHNPQTSSILSLVSSMSPEKPSPRSFYKRPLPESCVALSSKRGKEVFASALANAGLKSFFPLIEQL
jgi:glutathione gamma-glutamylcysteinyltransferase